MPSCRPSAPGDSQYQCFRENGGDTPVTEIAAPDDTAASSDPRPGQVSLVVGHDGTAASDAALVTAIDLAHRLGAQLHVVHSVTLDDYGVDPDTDAYEQQLSENIAHERTRIADAFAGSTVSWTYHQDRGDPARQIAHLAAEVDAYSIIVGATHSGPLHHLLAGDAVSKRLLRAQQRPVVVVPAPHEPT
jgi:nucleotide-binding universal stress UspA family protein